MVLLAFAPDPPLVVAVALVVAQFHADWPMQRHELPWLGRLHAADVAGALMSTNA